MPERSNSAEARRALQGKQVRLRIAPDGATEIVDRDLLGGKELTAIFSQMPATLPKNEIQVGQTWSRVMVAPVAGGAEARGGGKLEVTFRLDSIARDEETAYVSLVGKLTHASERRDTTGVTQTMSGSLTGGLVLDRGRGWITEARMTYVVRSLVTPAAGGPSATLRFRMKITQWMRVVP